MTDKFDRLVAIREETLTLLRAHRELWREVQGEFHSMYDEIPTWILLYEDSDLRECHEAFVKIVEPFMAEALPVQFTVSYSIRKGPFEIAVDFLNDNEEILNALSDSRFGSQPENGLIEEPSVFIAEQSGSRPA